MEMNELFRTERVKVGDLVPHAKNPRKISAVEKRRLLERMEKYGMIGIPTRDADGTMLSGHKRCEVLVEAGMADYETDVRTAVRKLTEAEAKEIMLIENVHAGVFDEQLLRDEFAEMVDLDSYGLSLDELTKSDDALAEQLNEDAPELPVVAKFSEKYSSIVIVCGNEIDFNHLAEKLGLDREKCYKSSKVGTTQVIGAKAVIAAFAK